MKYLLTAILFCSLTAAAQKQPAILRTTAGSFDYSVDGKKETWNIVPGGRPILMEVPAGRKQTTRVVIETGLDTVSYLLRSGQRINFLVVHNNDTIYSQLAGVPKNANFTDSYIRERKGKFEVDIPEVQELAKIMVALSRGGSSDSGITNMRTRYYQEVMAHFGRYQHHPIIDTISRYIKDGDESSYWYYYDWKMNANAYKFTKDGKIVNKGPIRKMGFKETADPFVKYAGLAADFAAKSGFRKFYASHKGYYDSLLREYTRYNPVQQMKNWLEEQFPYQYDYFLITWSPLTSGAHATGSFEDNGFRQTVMFSAGVTINRAFNQAVNEMLNSRVLFTEIDHNYVNPHAEKYREDVNEAMNDKNKWAKGIDDNSTYADPMSTFQEYMTWAVFSLYCLSYYQEADVMTFIERMERQMEQRRGFNNFKAFNRELMRLYLQYNKTRKAHELYPEILSWCKKQ